MTSAIGNWRRECGVFHTTYEDDMALRATPLARARIALVILAALAFGILARNYELSVANQVGIAAVGAIGLNILVGFTGQISLAQGAFLGVGAYTSAYLTTRLGVPFWFALPAAGLVTAAVGGIFGIPSLRLKGLYLVIATLAAQVVIEWFMVHVVPITGGSQGIFGIPAPRLGPLVFDTERAYYFLTIAALGLTVLATANLFRTRVGRAFIAIRDQDIAASVIGIDLVRYKVLAFAVSSFVVGLAGALQAHHDLVVSPEKFDILVSIEYLGMVIIGGLGTVSGSIYGAAFIRLLPIVLSTVARGLFGGALNVATREAIFGAAIVGFLILEPRGLAKLWHDLKDYFRLWPFKY
ncbi:MAG: branched-chain amino acid ABC transporter permease [Chloroflexota bacterium]|nr:branched-chain amino acid ABC transporter permease [Chloroflexota bacterium]